MTRILQSEPLFEGESVVVKARVQNPETLENVLTAEIAELRLLVYDLDGATPNKPVHRDTLSVPDQWEDTLQTNGWRGRGGWNFQDRIPGEHFRVEGGHRYKARHEVTLNDGQFFVIAETTVPVLSRW